MCVCGASWCSVFVWCVLMCVVWCECVFCVGVVYVVCLCWCVSCVLCVCVCLCFVWVCVVFVEFCVCVCVKWVCGECRFCVRYVCV